MVIPLVNEQKELFLFAKIYVRLISLMDVFFNQSRNQQLQFAWVSFYPTKAKSENAHCMLLLVFYR